MSDRQLLERAAKAVGLYGQYCNDKIIVTYGAGDIKFWNPLTDDGDCARLEAAIGIDVNWHKDRVNCWIGGVAFSGVFKDHGDDKNRARRWASVNTAALLAWCLEREAGADDKASR